ncbi:MAG TPA: hypothetical protein VLL07_05505 [Pontiella sp.]|nr:hypothetical protein [Pontiella sp.]
MTDEKYHSKDSGTDAADLMLQQLIHLKRFETPDPSRMVRNKQNIMRQIRQESQNQKKSLGDLIEFNFPWLFAEPKYGVALLFVAFAGLQYLGVNARQAANSQTGIYTTPIDQFAGYEQSAAAVSNAIPYPEVPGNLRLFGDVPKSQDSELVEYLQRK